MAGPNGKASPHPLKAGIRELARHRPDRALRLLREAVDSCPANDSRALERRLYWMAVALLRLDQPEVALKSLSSARKIRPRGLAAAAFAARANGYGMPRRASAELDDFYAFYSIQTCLFLSRKPGKRFSSESEKDSVTRLVAFAWQEVKRSGRLKGLKTADRLELFRTWPRVFPNFVRAACSEPRDKDDSCACEVISVDFSATSRRGM